MESRRSDQAARGVLGLRRTVDQVARHQLDIDFATIPTLAERHRLRLG